MIQLPFTARLRPAGVPMCRLEPHLALHDRLVFFCFVIILTGRTGIAVDGVPAMASDD